MIVQRLVGILHPRMRITELPFIKDFPVGGIHPFEQVKLLPEFGEIVANPLIKPYEFGIYVVYQRMFRLKMEKQSPPSEKRFHIASFEVGYMRQNIRNFLRLPTPVFQHRFHPVLSGNV